MKQFDRVEATFRPARNSDLVDGAQHWIGWRGVWEAVWVIDSGEFDGEWAMAPRSPLPLPPFAWAPLSDLGDVGDAK